MSAQELQRRVARAIADALEYGHEEIHVSLAGITVELLELVAGTAGGAAPALPRERAARFRREAEREERVVAQLEARGAPAVLGALGGVADRRRRIEHLRRQADQWDELGRRRGAGTLPDSPAAAPPPPDETTAAPAPVLAASRG